MGGGGGVRRAERVMADSRAGHNIVSTLAAFSAISTAAAVAL